MTKKERIEEFNKKRSWPYEIEIQPNGLIYIKERCLDIRLLELNLKALTEAKQIMEMEE